MKSAIQKPPTINEVAAMAGIPVSSMSRYLAGMTRPPESRAIIIEKIIGVPAMVFLTAKPADVRRATRDRVTRTKGRPKETRQIQGERG